MKWKKKPRNHYKILKDLLFYLKLDPKLKELEFMKNC